MSRTLLATLRWQESHPHVEDLASEHRVMADMDNVNTEHELPFSYTVL